MIHVFNVNKVSCFYNILILKNDSIFEKIYLILFNDFIGI